jgi:amidophosphoribosyltransferase
VAADAIETMCSQDVPVFVRMLVLPGHVECCHLPALELLAPWRERVSLNVMAQYLPDFLIQPSDGARNADVKRKHNANRALIKGKRVILVDDSIVRGTTSLKIVQMMRDAGAAEVHMRIASPPTRHSCFYGVDTPESSKLLAYKLDVAGMTDFIHADSLSFVSIDGLYKALGEAHRADIRPKYCDACFTGDYPTTLTDHDDTVTVDQFALLAERVI